MDKYFSLELKVYYFDGCTRRYIESFTAEDNPDAIKSAKSLMKKFGIKGYFKSVKNLIYSVSPRGKRPFHVDHNGLRIY